MLKFLKNQKYPTVVLGFGFFLIIASHFKIEDITKLEISVAPSPVYPIFIIGLLFCTVSVILFLLDELTVGWIKPTRIAKLNDGYSIKLKKSEISVRFGKLESLANSSKSSLVVLPANEFFDDECIHDQKSSLGAFVNSRFINQTKEIQKLVSEELKHCDSKEVEKEKDLIQKSYGVGAGVFLKNPLSSTQPLLFLSVTTKRAGEGLRAEISYIFQAISETQRIMSDKRLDSVFIPIIGSGHGGLRKEVALFGMLLAICDAINKPHGHHIENFNIVIFQRAPNIKPEISKATAKRLLRMAIGMYS